MLETQKSVKVGHKGLNLWAISYSNGGCLLELQDYVELGKDRGKPPGVQDPTRTPTREGYVPLGGYPRVG